MAELNPEEASNFYGGRTPTQEEWEEQLRRAQQDPMSLVGDLMFGNKDTAIGRTMSALGGGIDPIRSGNEASSLIKSLQLARDVRNAPAMDALFRAGVQAPGRANPYNAGIADQSRPAQLALLAQMRQQAAGPSLAGMQGQQAMGQGLQAALRGGGGRAGMVGLQQQGGMMAADVARARLAEAMRAQAGMGGLAGGLRGGDLRSSEAQARAGLQQRQQDDALRQFYAQQGGTLQNARDQATANREIVRLQALSNANRRDVQNGMNFANQAASTLSMGAGGIK